MQDTFTFTRLQLSSLLNGTIEMFIEYRDQHGKDEDGARLAAIFEMFDGLDASVELVAMGELDARHAGFVIDGTV